MDYYSNNKISSYSYYFYINNNNINNKCNNNSNLIKPIYIIPDDYSFTNSSEESRV